MANSLYVIRNLKKDFYTKLSPQEKREIELGLKQIEAGEVEE